MPTFDTGFANLPDVGTLSYNGRQFSSLFHSRASLRPMPDNAGRTNKATEVTIEVDGVVTLPPSFTLQATIDTEMENLRRDLEAFGGVLVYQGKGLGQMVVNQQGGGLKDIAWGPKPTLLDFQPLGGSRSAMVKWSCTTMIAQDKQISLSQGGGVQFNPFSPQASLLPPGGVVQFNEETSLSFDDECYSSLSIRGTLEIPLTRRSVSDRTVTDTVDNYRRQYEDITVDLTRYRVTRRSFNVSRDKRTCEWEYAAEELPPMGLPPNCTSARGEFSVRPAKQGMGLVRWVCTLRGTYVVRKDQPRRWAWVAFVSLLKFRMQQSRLGVTPPGQGATPAQQNAPPSPAPAQQSTLPAAVAAFNTVAAAAVQTFLISLNAPFSAAGAAVVGKPEPRCWIFDFGFTEGLYLDSKTMTFTATWMLLTPWATILRSTGVWLPQQDVQGSVGGGNLWKSSVQDIQGWRSWLVGKADLVSDAIVDLGGP